MQLTGAEIIIECLLEQSVDTVFGYPGGAILNVYDALYRYSDKIKHVLTFHGNISFLSTVLTLLFTSIHDPCHAALRTA